MFQKPVYNKLVSFKLTEKQFKKFKYILSLQENTQTEFLRQIVIKEVDSFEKKN